MANTDFIALFKIFNSIISHYAFVKVSCKVFY